MSTFDQAIIDHIAKCTKDVARHYKHNFDETKQCNYELCKECGGKCCKCCGCHFSPDDFSDLSFDGLLKEIQKGYITLEIVDGEHYAISDILWLVRMRNMNSPVIERRIYERERAACVALKENGCALDFTHRPSGGKLLIPAKNRECTSSYTVRESLLEWRVYKDILVKLVNFIGEKDYPCTI
jgi:hypothetical protein